MTEQTNTNQDNKPDNTGDGTVSDLIGADVQITDVVTADQVETKKYQDWVQLQMAKEEAQKHANRTPAEVELAEMKDIVKDMYSKPLLDAKILKKDQVMAMTPKELKIAHETYEATMAKVNKQGVSNQNQVSPIGADIKPNTPPVVSKHISPWKKFDSNTGTFL